MSRNEKAINYYQPSGEVSWRAIPVFLATWLSLGVPFAYFLAMPGDFNAEPFPYFIFAVFKAAATAMIFGFFIVKLGHIRNTKVAATAGFTFGVVVTLIKLYFMLAFAASDQPLNLLTIFFVPIQDIIEVLQGLNIDWWSNSVFLILVYIWEAVLLSVFYANACRYFSKKPYSDCWKRWATNYSLGPFQYLKLREDAIAKILKGDFEPLTQLRHKSTDGMWKHRAEDTGRKRTKINVYQVSPDDFFIDISIGHTASGVTDSGDHAGLRYQKIVEGLKVDRKTIAHLAKEVEHKKLLALLDSKK